MGDPYGGIGGVDVLTAGARRPIGVDPEILLVDLDLLGHLLEERGDLHGGEGRGGATAASVSTAGSNAKNIAMAEAKNRICSNMCCSAGQLDKPR